jgi:hypothetical protein
MCNLVVGDDSTPQCLVHALISLFTALISQTFVNGIESRFILLSPHSSAI